MHEVPNSALGVTNPIIAVRALLNHQPIRPHHPQLHIVRAGPRAVRKVHHESAPHIEIAQMGQLAAHLVARGLGAGAAHGFGQHLGGHKAFYRAENYHQDYAYYNPDNPYIQVCDRPKIAALKKQFPDLFVDYTPKK